MRGTPREAGLAVLLAAIAGFVDAAGYLLLDGLFVAHVTGDTDKVGQGVGAGSLGPAAVAGLVVLEWAAAILAGTFLLELLTRRRLPAIRPVLLVEAALLVGVLVWAHAGFYGRAGLTACAMGLQTATVAKWGRETIRTTYLSGMLTRFAQHIVNLAVPPPRGRRSYLRDTLGFEHDRRHSAAMVALYLLLWTGFAAGGAFGAWSTLHWQRFAFALPLGGLVVAVVIELG